MEVRCLSLSWNIHITSVFSYTGKNNNNKKSVFPQIDSIIVGMGDNDKHKAWRKESINSLSGTNININMCVWRWYDHIYK